MNQNISSYLKRCNLCNRHCFVDRVAGQTGYCGQTSEIYAARAALHFWEEPCISGSNGSGAVFFSGCSLKCVFCQNHDIAIGQKGIPVSSNKLTDTFLMLQSEGAHNINLVTPTQFIPQIANALENAKNKGLTIPIVYNTGSYETVDALKILDGLIDIYLPDLKYYCSDLSTRYANAPDYFHQATLAISEMYRQVGTPIFEKIAFSSDDPDFSQSPYHEGYTCEDDEDISENHLLKRGIIVRHLLLPGTIEDSKKILQYLWNTYKNNIYISIMNQYTPVISEQTSLIFPELKNHVASSEYDEIVNYAIGLGIEQAFIQDGSSSADSFIPPFNFKGLL